MAHHHLETDEAGSGVGRGELRALRAWCGKQGSAQADSSGARRVRNAKEKPKAVVHPGRPPGPAHDRRMTFTVRLSAHEWAQICRLARRVGTPARVLMRIRIIGGGGALV